MPVEPALQSVSWAQLQEPLTQVNLGGHACPHAPQLAGSINRFLHPFGVWQHVWPAMQGAPPLHEQMLSGPCS